MKTIFAGNFEINLRIIGSRKSEIFYNHKTIHEKTNEMIKIFKKNIIWKSFMLKKQKKAKRTHFWNEMITSSPENITYSFLKLSMKNYKWQR